MNAISAAKSAFVSLCDSIGTDPISAGDLDDRQEPEDCDNPSNYDVTPAEWVSIAQAETTDERIYNAIQIASVEVHS